MRILLVLLALSFTAPTASAGRITFTFALRDAGLTTNALIYDGAFDVYEVQLHNPNSQGATAVEMSLLGSFIQAGSTTFRAGSALPVVIGNDAPDTYFVLPVGTNPADVIDTETVDDATGLSSSFSIAGGAEIIPPGLSVVAVFSIPSGANLPAFPGLLGRATINGQSELIATLEYIDPCDLHPNSPDCPEPSTALLALLGLIGLAVRSRS